MAPFDKRHPNAVLELIIHAGDVGRPEIIEQLNAIAPTHAVRGNVDTQSWARTLPDTRVVEAGGLRLFVLHVRAELAIDPVIAGYAAVIFGTRTRPRSRRAATCCTSIPEAQVRDASGCRSPSLACAYRG